MKSKGQAIPQVELLFTCFALLGWNEQNITNGVKCMGGLLNPS